MTVAVPPGQTISAKDAPLAEIVAAWAAFSYTLQGVDAHLEAMSAASEAGLPSSPVQVVVVPTLRRIECAVDESTDMSAVAQIASEAANGGWRVWVLSPLSRLAATHTDFPPVAEYLQGWWFRQDGSVTFTEPQVP